MTANPQRVDVARLSELLAAHPSIPTYHVDDQPAVNELLEALPALLQQLAERDAEIEIERSRLEHTQQWYAERLVKIKEIAKREGLWNEVAAVIANGSGTRQLPDGSYFYDPPTYAQQLNSAKHRAEAAEAKLAERDAEVDRCHLLLDAKEYWRERAETAERGRNDAMAILLAIDYAGCLGAGMKTSIAAFLAANGGENNG